MKFNAFGENVLGIEKNGATSWIRKIRETENLSWFRDSLIGLEKYYKMSLLSKIGVGTTEIGPQRSRESVFSKGPDGDISAGLPAVRTEDTLPQLHKK